MTIERVPQRTPDDCLVCCVAMVTDFSYEEVEERWGNPLDGNSAYEAYREAGYDPLRVNWLWEVDNRRFAQLAALHDTWVLTVESPVSERRPDVYHEWSAEDGTFVALHAVVVHEAELFDPAGNDYWRSFPELYQSEWPVWSGTALRPGPKRV